MKSTRRSLLGTIGATGGHGTFVVGGAPDPDTDVGGGSGGTDRDGDSEIDWNPLTVDSVGVGVGGLELEIEGIVALDRIGLGSEGADGEANIEHRLTADASFILIGIQMDNRYGDESQGRGLPLPGADRWRLYLGHQDRRTPLSTDYTAEYDTYYEIAGDTSDVPGGQAIYGRKGAGVDTQALVFEAPVTRCTLVLAGVAGFEAPHAVWRLRQPDGGDDV